MSTEGDATRLLARWAQGDRAALDQVVALLYEQMHLVAARQLRGERNLTIQPTSLVNDVYLRLVQLNHIDWQDRRHFMAMFARVARQALVDDARKRRAGKRDQALNITLNDERGGVAAGDFGLIEVDELMNQLQQIDEPAAQVVELRVFGGMSIEEAAEQLGVSEATVSRKWRAGKTWLARELGVAAPDPG